MNADNVYQVFDGLWSSCQLSARSIEGLPELGIKVVINLALPNWSNTLPGEAERIATNDISYFHTPLLLESQIRAVAVILLYPRYIRG